MRDLTNEDLGHVYGAGERWKRHHHKKDWKNKHTKKHSDKWSRKSKKSWGCKKH